MKEKLLPLLLALSCSIIFADSTPKTVSMSSSDNNATAFTSDGSMGTDNTLTGYIHWDATYLYLGWTGGSTNYSSDLYYASIDTDPDGTNGSSASIEGVSFQTGNHLPDFYVVYENNSSFYGAPATNGNAFEIYQNSSGSWSWVSRTDGDDGSSSQVTFSGSGGEVRLRIAWSTLSFTPGASAKLGIILWANNSSGSYLWSSNPTSNPTGSTAQTLTHQFIFSSTGDGVTPSSAGTETPLPVELTSFSSKIIGSEVYLNWQTATEVNNYGFEIEKSMRSASTSLSSGKQSAIGNWEKIGFVHGHGNSNSQKDYSFVDNKISLTGKYYYRLKQIDTDGSFEYSGVVEADFGQPNKFELMQNYPNPFNPTTKITYTIPYDSKVKLMLYNTIGQVVRVLENQNKAAGSYSINIDASGLNSGVYFYKIEAGSFVQIRKMIIAK